MPERGFWDDVVDWMDANGWTFRRLTQESTLPRTTWLAVIRGTQPITEEIANELARVTGRAASEWLAIQSQHDARKG